MIGIESTICDTLSRIEDECGVEILWAVESGSRAWGFESPDSDYDVRFVYKRPLSWYLSVNERRDVLEPKTQDPLDVNGWDIKKALFQIYRGNPAFSEWVNTPICYLGDRDGWEPLLKTYWNRRSAIYHYLHMASGNYRTYLRNDEVPLKKYLYVVRPLLACQYIQHGPGGMPPVNFRELRRELTYPAAEVADILDRKSRCAELGLVPRIDSLNKWIEDQLELYTDLARTQAKVSLAPDDLNEFFYNEVKEW